MKKFLILFFDNLFFIASLFSVFLGLGYLIYGDIVLNAPSTLESVYYSLSGAFLFILSVLLFMLGASENRLSDKADKFQVEKDD